MLTIWRNFDNTGAFNAFCMLTSAWHQRKSEKARDMWQLGQTKIQLGLKSPIEFSIFLRIDAVLVNQLLVFRNDSGLLLVQLMMHPWSRTNTRVLDLVTASHADFVVFACKFACMNHSQRQASKMNFSPVSGFTLIKQLSLRALPFPMYRLRCDLSAETVLHASHCPRSGRLDGGRTAAVFASVWPSVPSCNADDVVARVGFCTAK